MKTYKVIGFFDFIEQHFNTEEPKRLRLEFGMDYGYAGWDQIGGVGVIYPAISKHQFDISILEPSILEPLMNCLSHHQRGCE